MPKRYAREFRQAICERLVAGERVSKLSNETGVSPATLHRWKDQALIDAGLKEGTKSIEVDELAEARRTIEELEAELAAVKAATALFNAATRGGVLAYRAIAAQWHADRRAMRPKTAKLAVNEELRRYVQDRLAGTIAGPGGELVAGPQTRWIGRRHGRRQDRRWAKAWSPEQIANRLRVDFPHDETMRISHEAIYQALYVQGRGALRRELVACLRTGRALRVPRARTQGRGKKFVRPEIMISERPAEVADRAVPGHWEGDLILGGFVEGSRNRLPSSAFMPPYSFRQR